MIVDGLGLGWMVIKGSLFNIWLPGGLVNRYSTQVHSEYSKDIIGFELLRICSISIIYIIHPT